MAEKNVWVYFGKLSGITLENLICIQIVLIMIMFPFLKADVRK